MSSILIISRDEQITGSLRAELDNRGKYCVVVSGANEALRLLNSLKFELIFIDLFDIDPDGFSLASEIRLKGIRVPIFVLSEKANEMDLHKSLEAGINAYLSKPVENQDIDEILKQWLKYFS